MYGKGESTMEAGKHEFGGACDPSSHIYHHNLTFSVGIFQWVPKAGGKGLKRTAVKVRVTGFSSRPEGVYEAARKIVAELDAGTYTGKKHVRIGTA
jgi:hypothetical protein